MHRRIAPLLALLASLVAAPAWAQDRDGDRVLDAVDLCPDASEGERTVFPGDGCPDTDGDHDGVVDDYDACPGAAETANGLRDLDGCPDEPSAPPPLVGTPGADPTRVGCFEGAALLDVAGGASGSTQLLPREDAPAWMGTSPLECYAAVSYDGRHAIHCASADGTAEATLALRVEGGAAIGVVAFRSSHGLDHRPWSGRALPSFDRERVAEMVAAQGEALGACYEQVLVRTPGLAGRVTVRLTVTPTGALTDVRVASDTLWPARPEVGECIVRVVAPLVIPDPPRCRSVTLSFPLAFEPEP